MNITPLGKELQDVILSMGDRGYTIEYFDEFENYISTYVNFDNPLPSLKESLEKYHESKKHTMKIYHKQNVHMIINRIDQQYINVSCYMDFKSYNLIDSIIAPITRVKKYNIIFKNEQMESVYCRGDGIIAETFSSYGGHLHGNQILLAENKKYIFEYRHGRLQNIYMYTGGIFSYGTKLLSLPLDHEYTKYMKEINKLIKGL